MKVLSRGALPCLLLSALLARGGVAEAACAEPVSARALAQSVSAGDVAFADLDEEGFQKARWEAGQAVPCLQETLSTGQAASYHRLEALASFLDRDHANAVMSFRSVLAIAPGYSLPDSLAPEGHPLRLDFQVAMGLVKTPGLTLSTPEDGSIFVDGTTASEVPTDRPYIFQHVDDNGAIVTSQLVRPGMPVPSYVAGKEVRSRSSSTASRSKGRLQVNMPLALTAGAAALASGGFYLAANGRSARYWDPATAPGELGGLRQQTNTLQGLSLGAGVIALGAGAGAVVVGSF